MALGVFFFLNTKSPAHSLNHLKPHVCFKRKKHTLDYFSWQMFTFLSLNGDSLKKMCELNGENTDVLEKGARGGGGGGHKWGAYFT